MIKRRTSWNVEDPDFVLQLALLRYQELFLPTVSTRFLLLIPSVNCDMPYRSNSLHNISSGTLPVPRETPTQLVPARFKI